MPFFFFFNSENDVKAKILAAFDEFGISCEVDAVPVPKGLPFFVSDGKAFFEASVLGQKVLLVSFVGKEVLYQASLKKTYAQMQQLSRHPVAFCFDALTDAQRKSLLENGIPFVSAPSTIFLPFLGVAFRKRKKLVARKVKRVSDVASKLSPSAQAFFLFMLYKVKDGCISKAQAAQMSGWGPMSVVRYSRELAERGLVKEIESGRSIMITCAGTGRALFEKALPYLDSPIRERKKIIRPQNFSSLPLAGECALSQVTQLAEPRSPVAACAPRSPEARIKGIPAEKRSLIDEVFVELQVWKYDPGMFMDDGCVDPVSLYLSLMDSPNERVQAALKEMLENVKW